MKRTWLGIITAALLLCLPMTALATENATLSADTVTASAGGTVTVPVRLEGNPGFTNFAVSLEYDKEKLTLVSLNTQSEESSAYLCGSLTAGNPEWKAEEETADGYLTGASAEVITGDGILFTATFRLAADFSGTASVKPVVHYLRNGGEAGFADVAVTAKAGAVELAGAVIKGDLNADGVVNSTDSMLAYAYCNRRYAGNERFLSAADVNGDLTVNSTDAMMIYAYVNRKLEQFPAAQTDDGNSGR